MASMRTEPISLSQDCLESLMPYRVISRLEHGGYRDEGSPFDLPQAVRLSTTWAHQTLRRHYILDEIGRIIDVINPVRSAQS